MAVVMTAASLAFGALVLAAVAAPAAVFDVSTASGGAGHGGDLDLLAVSALVGLPYAAYLQSRLRASVSSAEGPAITWLSALHGLVVLALTASGLPAVVLHASARLHARVVEDELPVLVGWAALLCSAVLLSEGARRLSLRWLRAEPAPATGVGRSTDPGAPQGAGSS